MKTRLIVSFLLCAFMIPGFACYKKAWAQISTNLDALPPSPASSPDKAKPVRHNPAPQVTHAPSVKATLSSVPKTQKEPPSPPGYTTVPAVPLKAPPNIVIAPSFVPVQKHPPVPPEEVKVDLTAKSTFLSLGSDEKRVLFSAQSAKLNQATFDAITAMAKTLAEQPRKRIRLESYATGADDDASLSRRVSLERAIIIRSLLMFNNVASTRIYPIAHGPADRSDRNPPDRVDIHLLENPVKIMPNAELQTPPPVLSAPKEGAKNKP